MGKPKTKPENNQIQYDEPYTLNLSTTLSLAKDKVLPFLLK